MHFSHTSAHDRHYRCLIAFLTNTSFDTIFTDTHLDAFLTDTSAILTATDAILTDTYLYAFPADTSLNAFASAVDAVFRD
jgi:hypothetical protein